MVLLLVYAEFFVELIHSPRVEENNRDEGENRALLSKPEAQIGAPDMDAGQERP